MQITRPRRAGKGTRRSPDATREPDAGTAEQAGDDAFAEVPDPARVLRSVAMPGWAELHVRQIKLPTESSRRYALVAVDEWRDREPAPATAGVRASDRSDIEEEIRQAARHAETVRAEREERRRSPNPTGEDMKILRAMQNSVEGRLAYACAVIAAEVEQSPVWTDDAFVSGPTKVDLIAQVVGIVRNCRALRGSKDALGPRPDGVLADDPDVQAIYDRLSRGHAERLAAVTRRVEAFLRYRDHIRECEPLREKFAWIEAHDVVDDGDRRAAEDRHAGSELSEASAQVTSRIEIAAKLLGEDVVRLADGARRVDPDH